MDRRAGARCACGTWAPISGQRRALGLCLALIGAGTLGAPRGTHAEPITSCTLISEESPTGGILEFSSAERILVRVEVQDDAGPVEPLRLATEASGLANFEIEVALTGTTEVVPVRLISTGLASLGSVARGSVLMSIPREGVGNAIDGYLEDLDEEWADQTDPEIVQVFRENREAIAAQLAERFTGNQPGDFEGTCRFTPTSSGYWNGVVEAPPLRFVIVDKGSVFDEPPFE